MTGKIPISRIRLFRIDERALSFADKVGVSPLTALLLRMRGLSGDGIDEARTWLRPGLSDSLASVSLGPGARDAALLWQKMKGARRVVIYGDYDVDGASATALAMEMALESFREVRYFIPHRHREGYGVHEKVVRALAESGCDLLVTVDCGTRDISALRAARDAGIPVIIFDHHTPGESLPEGAIVVNPHIGGDDEARTLCAAGVLWVWAMTEGVMHPDWLEGRSDLAALATLADHVPLGRLNRGLVRRGMDVIRLSGRRGLRRLLDETGVQAADVDEEAIVMKIIPCLNAAGRLGLADIAVDVLLGGEGLEKNVRELVSLNRKRQSISAEILEKILPEISGGESLVLSDLSWP
ncbi:MAG TPA: recombinase RecJ, partial [Synergistetes bacterium]|nr:recombinase RecJ [Synergistota bacterium]